jgi:predicted RNA binding protein YcfA (HicA-like mRNA interferase family)
VVRVQRVLTRVLSGSSDQNIRFNDLRNLLLALGFDERVRGSHHIFTRDDIVEIINLQSRTGRGAKPYQVRQVRDLIVNYQLAREIEK